VPQYSTLRSEFAAFLQRERDRIIPFVGAGLSVEAGVPAARKMAALITEKAHDRGLEVGDGLGFDDVCAAVTDQLSHRALKEIVAEIVSVREVTPSPVLKLLVRCPTRIVITTNYDPALAETARVVGLKPVIHDPRSARALERPAEGSVAILHLHGSAADPETLALPGPSLEAPKADEPFKTVLRGLVLPHVVVYLGYRLPPADEYLRQELVWLATAFEDRGTHALLLPRDEVAQRQQELAPLQAHAGVQIETFDAERGFQAPQHAALIIAPRAEVPAAPAVRAVREEDVISYFHPPALLAAEDDEERDPVTRLSLARLGVGDPVVPPPQLLDARRALVVAEPGMGKTQLLYYLGQESRDWTPLFLRLLPFAYELRRGDDVRRAFARALREARSFNPGTQRPTPEALESNAYLFLVDGLDEVEPEDRETVIAALAELVDRFAQHLFVVTSRPIPESAGLEDRGFRPYRIYVDDAWGRSYLLARGIPEARINELYRAMPTVADLLGIPLYAAFVGNRLSEEAQRPLPQSALTLITDIGVHDAVEIEAERTGDSPAELYRWLQTLAVCLEVRGRVQASVADLAAIPGPEVLEAQATRERLVLAALLKDRPEVAAFQTVTIQEGLAAEALLATDDPVATLRDVAVAEVGSQPVLRADLDHALDLFFENADTAVRAQLRIIDELRWARTQHVDIGEEEASETLRVLWSQFIDRRTWVERREERQVRGPRAVIRRLSTAFPEAAEALRAEVVAATTAEQPTTRGTGLAFLQEFPPNEENVGIIGARLQDENDVVRRAAAEAAQELGLADLVAELEVAYRADTDELALETIGFALLRLTPEAGRARLAGVLAENPVGWRRLDTYVVRALSLAELLDFFSERGLRGPDEERLFAEEVTRRSEATWEAEGVRKLAAIVVANARRYYGEFREQDLLQDLCTRFPAAALEGAREGAGNGTTWRDLLFLRVLDRELLEQAATGALEEPLRGLLEFLEFEAQRAEQPPPAQPLLPEQPPDRQRLSRWLADGRLTETRCPDSLGVTEQLMRQVPDLTRAERARLRELVEAWWPQDPLAEVVRVEGSTTTAPAGLSSALAASSALDLPLDPDRWIEILGSRALRVWWDAADWLGRHFPAERSQEIAALVSGITDDLELSLTLRAVPALDEALASALAQAMIAADSPHSGNVLARLREEGLLDALRTVSEDAQSDLLQRLARRQLAQAGDLAAQRSELRAMLEDVEADPSAYEQEGLQWASQARSEVLPELAELFKAVARNFGPSESDLSRSLTTALAATRDDRALAIYDEFIEGEEFVSGSFYRYQREDLARALARERVLARLPEELDEVAVLLAAHGYELR
jgi:SIR2-like domain